MDPLSKRPSNIMQEKFLRIVQNGGVAHDPGTGGPREARPDWYFFYGTLSNPQFLAKIAELNETPTLIKAKLGEGALSIGAHIEYSVGVKIPFAELLGSRQVRRWLSG